MKRFYRSNNKMIAGVCSGLGTYFGIDPILVRIFFALSLLVNGMGLFAYILIWIVSDYASYHEEQNMVRNKNASRTLGYILIMSGSLFLLDYIIPDIDGQVTFGIAMLAIGGALIYKNLKKSSFREQQI